MIAVMISIRPKWCGLIKSGIKGVEVRKTRPTITLPFTCYINQTQGGGVIGEFICDKVMQYTKVGFDGSHEPPRYMRHDRAGMVFDMSDDLRQMCLSKEQFEKYANGGYAYGWHISNLKIYDQPKKVTEFLKPCRDPYRFCDGCKHGIVKYPAWVETREDLDGVCYDTECLNTLHRPPQSWCYVEELK